MKIHHFGFICEDIQKTLQSFLDLGYTQETELIKDDRRRVFLCFIKNNENCLELVCPYDEKSDVYATMKRVRGGVYHICYTVENIASTVERLTKNGWLLVKKAEPAVAFSEKDVVFLFKKDLGLIELVEK